MNEIEFTVRGRPISQSRPRVTQGGRHTFMPKHYVEWCEQVKDEAQTAAAELVSRGEPWDAHGEAYRVRLHFFMPDLRRTDVDKLAASILDALKHAGIYEDDSLVDDLSVKRPRLSPDRANPRVEVRVELLIAKSQVEIEPRKRARRAA